MSEANKKQLRNSINNIEAGYEFMLAYAAQGRDIEHVGGGGGPSIRGYLIDMATGLETIANDFDLVIKEDVKDGADVFVDFVEVLRTDADKSKKAVNLVLAIPSIGSQVIDNLNASIHLRALLTGLFLVDEALSSLTKAPQ